MAFDRSSINLGSRFSQQAAIADSFGEGGKSYLDTSKTKLKFYKMSVENKNVMMNILPYQITTNKHPEVVAGRRKVGQWDYLLDVWVHKNIGPNKETILCPRSTYGKACPICDERQKLLDAGREEEAKALRAKRRCVYNVQIIDRNGPAEKPMIFEVSHINFNKELIEEASASVEPGEGPVPFADPGPAGRVVAFRVSEESLGKTKFPSAKSFKFLERDEEIEDSVLEACAPLDQLLIVPTSKQLEDALYGGGDFGEEQSDAADDYEEPAQNRRQYRQEEAEDDQPAQSSRRSYRQEAEDDRNDYRRDQARDRRQTRNEVPAEDQDAPAETNYEDAPRQSRRQPAENPEETRGEQPKDEKPMDDTPAQEQPSRQARAQREDNPCPAGLNWGKDCDSQPACGRCPDAVYDRCRAAGRRCR